MSDLKAPLFDWITDFLAHKTTATVFSLGFIQAYKQTLGFFDEPSNRLLDAVFAACDAYCEDPTLRDHYDLDEAQLYTEIQRLYSGFAQA